MNEPEASPPDPYTEKRRDPRRTYVTKSDFDQLKRFLTLDRQVTLLPCFLIFANQLVIKARRQISVTEYDGRVIEYLKIFRKRRAHYLVMHYRFAVTYTVYITVFLSACFSTGLRVCHLQICIYILGYF